MSLDMCSAENPMEPTKSGRPHEPMNRVSPVNACRGKMRGPKFEVIYWMRRLKFEVISQMRGCKF